MTDDSDKFTCIFTNEIVEIVLISELTNKGHSCWIKVSCTYLKRFLAIPKPKELGDRSSPQKTFSNIKVSFFLIDKGK